MTVFLKQLQARRVIHTGTILFVLIIAAAYTVYPHWVTLSHFAEQWNTLILFICAMLVAMFELGYIATKVRERSDLTAGSNFLYASAFCIGLVVCVPYLGSAAQKDMHNIVALLFALSAAAGFTVLAKRLRNPVLGVLGGLIFGICMLELVLLSRYAAHPVQAWVWTVLELAATASLVIGLDVIAVTLGRGDKEPVK